MNHGYQFSVVTSGFDIAFAILIDWVLGKQSWSYGQGFVPPCQYVNRQTVETEMFCK
jgi:hypothetical protein